jgi:hypothetical protein
MRYSIDVAFLDRQLKILRVSHELSPWRVCRAPARTRHVIELPAGTLHNLRLQENTFVCLEHQELPARANGCTRQTRQHAAMRFSLRIPRCSRHGTESRRDLSRQLLGRQPPH